jgi:mono/diheme cytochrome c family protein
LNEKPAFSSDVRSFLRFSSSSFVIGIVATILVPAGIATAVIMAGYIPVNADTPPPSIEKHLAMFALHRVVDRVADQSDGPLPPTDVNLTAGAHLYEQNCAICHGASDGRRTTVAAGLYQKPPQFAKDGVDDDPAGETYWKIAHGIRFTGMPAYSQTLSEKESWQIALFLRHLPKLPEHAAMAWNTMRAPGQLAP